MTRVASVHGTPKGLFQDCDLFLGDQERSVYLLVDGSPGSMSGGGITPRRDLFNVVTSAWRKLVSGASPGDALRRLHEALVHHNQAQSGSSLIASAAACRLATDGRVFLAEAGDTKAWVQEGDRTTPVWSIGMPDSDVSALGCKADVRERTLEPGPRRLLLLTDGAFRALRDQGRANEGAILVADPLADLRATFARADHLEDDATLVVLDCRGEGA